MDWTDEERAIYGPYWNGTHGPDGKRAKVYGDPARLFRLLQEAFGGQYHQVCRDLFADYEEDGTPKAEPTPEEVGRVLKAITGIVAAVPGVFGLTPFDPRTGKGCDEEYCLQLFEDFRSWRLDLLSKKKTPPASSPSPASGPPAAGLGTPIS